MEFSLKEQFEGFIRTPQIFSEVATFEYPPFTTPVSNLDRDPANMVEPESRVLGKRMEHFFHYYITHFSSLEVVAHNRQIILNKQTLGELDFLLKNPVSGQVFHIELIYKYYLYDPDWGTSEKEHLIGPNRRDSLNRKLTRLQKKQFPLLFNEATLELLLSLKINPEDVVQKMCFKAFVFQPKLQKEVIFSEVSNDTIAGYLIRIKEFTPEVYGENLYFSPKKKFWPVNPDENRRWFKYSEVLKQVNLFMKEQLSLLMWMKTPDGIVEKFFIVWW